MSFDAGSIISTLDISRDPFQAGLRAARQEGRDFAKEKFEATADLNIDRVRAKLATIRGELTALQGRSVDVDVRIDEALTRIATVQAALSALHGSVDVDVRTAEARAQVETLQDILSALHGRADVDVDGIAAAMAQVAALRAQLDELNNTRARPDVDMPSATRAAGQVGGLSTMVAGLLTLLPAVIPVAGAAAGALAALGTGAALGVAGIGTILLGVSGIGDAYKALGDQQKQAGATAASGAASQKAAANAIASANQQLESSERSLSSARQNAAEATKRAAKEVVDARRQAEAGVSQALERQRTSEWSYTAAVVDAKRAQEGLTEAREDAKRSVEDLQFAVAGGAIAERRAVLQLQDAEAAMNDARERGITGRQLEDLTLSYQEASLSVQELTTRNQRLAKEQETANKGGIEGSKQVVAAQQQVASANDRVAEADRARQQAAAAVTEAQRAGAERMQEALDNQVRTQRQNAESISNALASVASAQRAVEQAHDRTTAAGVSGTNKVRDAMAELTPEGRKFVTFLDSQFRPALKGLKAEAQSNLLPGLQTGLEQGMQVMPLVSDLVGELAGDIGDLGARAGKSLNSPFWRNYFTFLKNEAGPTTQTFGTIFGNTMQGVAGISEGAIPIWHQMGGGLEVMTRRLAVFGQEAASGKSEKFNEFLAYVETNGPKVVRTVGDLAGALVDIGVSLAPVGGLVLDTVDGLSRFISALPPGVLSAISTGVWSIGAGFLLYKPVGIIMTGAAIGVAVLAKGVVSLGVAMGSTSIVGFGAKIASLAAFMGGPWGVAIGLAAVAIGALMFAMDHSRDSSRQLEDAERNYHDALVQSKGAIDESVRSTVQKSLADQTLAYSGEKLLDTTDKLGISQGTLTDAIIKGGKPLDDIRKKLQETADAHSSFGTGVRFTSDGIKGAYDGQGQAAADAMTAIDGLSDSYRRQQDAAVVARAAINGITVEQQKQRDATVAASDALLASIGADLSKEQTALRLEDAQKRYNDAVAEHGPKSSEARDAANNLNQTYLNLITQSGEAAAKQGELNGVVDTTQLRLDAQNRKALELAASLKGPLPEALQRVITGMSGTELAAAGAKVAVDNTGKAVITMPGGKKITLTDNSADTIKHFQAVQLALAAIDTKKNIELKLKTGQPVSRGELESYRAGDYDRLAAAGGSGGGLVGYGTNVMRFARGGVIGGYSPGVDSVPALLSPGESVLVPELTRAIGPSNILSANKAYSGRQPTMFSGGGIARFAAGGIAGALAPSSAPTAATGAAAVVVDPTTTEDATDAVTALTAATAQLTPSIAAATEAGAAQQAGAQQLVATGLSPLVDQLTKDTFPAFTETARLAGTVDVAALQALQAQLPPTQAGFVNTANVVDATTRRATGSAIGMQIGTQMALSGVQGALAVTRNAMSATADWAAARFNSIRAAAADPIRWVMLGPLGDAGLVGAWNSLDSQFQLNRKVTAFRPTFAAGGPVKDGPVRGAGTSTSDSIPALLSDGEFVVKASVAQRVPHFLTALNSGQAEAVQAAGGGGARMPGFADGGPVAEAVNRARKVAAAMSGKPYVWGGASPSGADCSGFQSIITNSLRGEGNPYHRIGTTDTFPWAGFAPGLGGAYAIGAKKGNPGHMAGTLAGTNAESGGSPSRVKFGAGAAGADSAQFTTRGFLPAIGGKFVSGGAGGQPFDVTPLVAEAFAGTRMQLAQLPGLYGRGQAASTALGVGTAAVDAAQGRGVADLEQMFASSGGGGNVDQYTGVINQALTMVGQPLSLNPTVKSRMQRESGGNPNSVNRWDVNWLNGTPSVGLMQVIGPTYAANKDPRADTGPYLYGVSTNPLSNILASMHYAIGRYGGLASAYNKPGGYDNGGPLPDGGIAVNTSGRVENVLSAAQGDALTERIRGGDGVDIEQLVDRLAAAIAQMKTLQFDVTMRPDESPESFANRLARTSETKRRLT